MSKKVDKIFIEMCSVVKLIAKEKRLYNIFLNGLQIRTRKILR